MGKRLDLHQILVDILGVPKQVYFQPPNGLEIRYPAIIYARDYAVTQHADNQPWSRTKRYQVTVIHTDPDNEIQEKVAMLPMCTFSRFYTADNLNHDVFTVYY